MDIEPEYNGVHFDELLRSFNDYEVWGIDVSERDTVKNGVLMRQTGFLASFSERGTILKAAAAAGISPMTVHRWTTDDKHGFNARMTAAGGNFLGRLEDMAFERILHPSGRIGSDILMITMLNAHAPEKYRTGIVVVDEVPKAVAAKLAKMAQEDKDQRDQAPAAVRADNVTQLEQMRNKANA